MKTYLYMNKFHKRALCVFLMSILTLGYASSVHAQVSFTGSTPNNGSNNVAKTASIVLHFSNSTSASSINSSNIVVRGEYTGEISGTFTGAGTASVTFIPAQDFKAGEKVTVVVSNGVTDVGGTPLNNPQSISFYTASDNNTLFSQFIPTSNALNTTADISSMGAADLDGDGDMDIVAISQSSKGLYWYQNDGNQNFTQQIINNTDLNIRRVKLIDLDRDGDMDILTGGEFILWYRNDGNGNFTATNYEYTDPNNPVSVSMADQIIGEFIPIDMDLDGDMDIVYSEGRSSFYARNLQWLENDGNNRFTKNLLMTSSKDLPRLDIGDIDNDGDLDILSSDFGVVFGDLSWYENSGMSFTKHTLASTGLFITNIELSDLDSDGDLDIVYSNLNDIITQAGGGANHGWFENQGLQNNALAFQHHYVNSTAVNFYSFDINDVDGDGDMDIVASTWDAQKNTACTVLLNDGNESFTEKPTNVISPNNLLYDTHFLLDIDLDGDLDILLIGNNDQDNFDKPIWIENKQAWIGGASNNWDTAANWSTGNIPDGSEEVLIFPTNNIPTASGNISVGGMRLTANAALTVNGTITNSGSITLESGSSLIAPNAVGTQLTYQRTLATDNWYLVSPPVADNYLNIYNNHNFATGTGNNIGMALYFPGVSESDWVYFDSSTISNQVYFAGSGMAVKLAAAGTLSFTGVLNTDASYSPVQTGGLAFSLLGNPYPSYLPVNGTSEANNFLQRNIGQLTEQTVWLWDASQNQYITVNQASPARYIAPGQAFFVHKESGVPTMDEDLQRHQSTDVFNRSISNTRPEVTLEFTDGQAIRSTDIFYIEGTTTGFDNGYDSTVFNQDENQLGLATKLVAGSDDKSYAIQSLPPTNFENMVIPIELITNAGSNLWLKANFKNLPVGHRIFLEDRNEQIFCEFETNGDSIPLNISENLTESGRFYLHITTSVLSNPAAVEPWNVKVYKYTSNILRVDGIDQGHVDVEIYDITGKKVLQASFTGATQNEVALPRLSAGIYIVSLKTNGKMTRRKIVL